MATIIGGFETGLQNTSLAILNRNDQTANNDPGHGTQLYVNVSNGNLIYREQDVFMPSLGDDYQLVRTYNVRGRSDDAHQHEDARWTFSTTLRLTVRNDGGETYIEVENGDGSFFYYHLNPVTGLYESTDGGGAFETIEDLGTIGDNQPSYILTRSDQTRLSFDSQGWLLKMEDTNGVTVDYVYDADRLVQVLDDQGHVLNYIYLNGQLFQVTDETEGVLVEYHYDGGLLSEVIDRFGHSTQYFYTNDGFLERVVLPHEQTVDSQLETYDNRELDFVYETVNWRGDSQAQAMVVTQVTDAMGNVTTFDYDFQFSQGADNTNGAKKGHLKKSDDTSDPTLINDSKFFEGGSTTVVDALGNNRAYSNEAQYVDWRLANGYYQLYDAAQAATDPSFQGQVDAIKNAHSLAYTYRADGYITEVIDQQGFHTLYGYDAKDNLVSITDANGWGAVHSDSAYYRQMRAELGVIDGAGAGKLTADLTQEEIDALTEAFTSHFEYDDHGNLTNSIDNADNVTTYTYTAFNKVTSATSAVGHALTTSNAAQYQQKRVELGYGALAEDLTAADSQALLDLHTTYFEYDANQNLIERRDAGGDITRFEYDAFGNLTKKTVYLDAADLSDPAKQQVTTYAYDGFGNNISSTDAEGYQTFSVFDHFGNLVQFTDANGGVSQFTYDNDNRLLTVTDPEGHTTVNTYDAVGNRISITDAAGHTITRVYDRNNRLIATIDPSASDPADDRTTTFEYDVVGNRTAVVDAEGRRTEYSFNSRRELVEVLTTEVQDHSGQPVRYLSSFAYDGIGNRISSTDNRGFTTEVLYTRNNLVRQQTDANGQITRMEYDADNNQVTIIAGYQLPPEKRQIQQFSYDEEDQLTRRTDAEGNVTTFAYDAPGNRIAATDANGQAMVTSDDPYYLDLRRELGYVDAAGQGKAAADLTAAEIEALKAHYTTYYEYDGNNRLVREILPEATDPATGQPVRYTIEHIFDGNGNEIETIDANGHSTTYTFDRDDRLVMVQDANDIKTVFEYDSRHNRTAVMINVDATADADGHITVADADQAQVTRFAYDEFNQLIARTDGMGNALAESDAARYQQMRSELGYAALVADLTAADQQALRELYTEHLAYDKVGNRISLTDHLDRLTSFQYDGLNRLTSATDALGRTTAMAYDGNGNLVKRTDALDRVTTYAYDSMNRMTDTTDALLVTTHRDYDDFGNLIAETRAAGTSEARTSTFEYDLNNRVIAQFDPEGHSQSVEYDAVGNRIRVVDGRGNATRYVYNALNRNVRIIDPLTFETRLEYDGAGNRISLIDARGGITRFEYDPGNRLVSITDAEGRVSSYVYDDRGNRIEQYTAFGTADQELTVFEYDAENNLRRVIDAEGGITDNDYDQVYNRIETVDANGHATISEFDAVNQLIRVTDAEDQQTEYSYDAVGNRVSVTDALDRTATLEYDDNNRLIRHTATDGVVTTYSYDAVGNRTAITRAAGTADAVTDTFVYDLDDRLIEQTDALGHSTTYDYDANHNRTVVTDPNGHSTVYTYDADNRVTHIQDPEGNVVRYDYDGNGNRTQVTDGRDFVSTTYYNADNEVIFSVDAEGYATGFVYDDNGNVTSQTLYMTPLTLPLDPAVAPAPAASADDQTTTFEYDKLNRVVARTDAEGYRTEFVYDAVGNRLQTRQYRDPAGSDIAVTHSYYDKVDRLTHSVTAEGYLTVLEYDLVGNRVSRTLYDQPVTIPASGDPEPVAGDSGRTTAMAYDAADRLVRQTSPAGVDTAFEYDNRGNRTAVIDADGTADQRRTDFVYDTADRLVDTIDALGTVTHRELDAAGNVVERHDAYGTADARMTTFEYDGNNRLIQKTDALTTVFEMTYDANGNLTSRTSAVGLAEERTETMEYDGNNRLIAQVNGEGERTESAYDGAGNRVRLTLAPGLAEERTNTFEFDRDNRLIAGTDGEGVRTEYRYDGAGNKIETIQAAGIGGQERHSYYTYDLDNRLVQVTDPMGGVTQYTYDVLGNQTQIINANGGVQTNTFDILGRMVTSLSAGDILTANTYDLRGNITSTTQSFGDGSDARTTTYAYDLLDRQVRVTDPEGFATSIDYDVFGNQTRVTHGQYLLQDGDDGYDDAKATAAFEQSNIFTYDAADRMLTMEDAEGNITGYGHDALGNRTSMTEAADSAPRTTTYTFDKAGRLIETNTPEGGIAQKIYDETGNLVQENILQSGDDSATQVWITKGYEYDGNARLTAEIDPYGVRTEFEYDAMGNRTVTRTAAGTGDQRITRSEYDLNNRVSAEIDGEGNRTEFAYDAMGNRIRVTDALGRVARYYFDGANNLVSILDAEGYINTFDYNAAGHRTGETVYMTRYSGPVDDYTAPAPTATAQDRISTSQYDGNGRIIQRTAADGSTTTYSYDGAGNLKQERQFTNTAAPRELLYDYDLNNRLIRFTDNTTTPPTVTTFTYDGANNKTGETITNSDDPNTVRTTTYGYDLNNRLVSQTLDPGGLNLVQTTAYDRAGNAVAQTDANGHTTRMEYDLNNRVVRQIDALGNDTLIAYDAAGNRSAVTDANGHTIEFVYDGNNRVVQQIGAQIQIYTLANGFETVQPTITHAWDAAGNEVQTVDGAGFVTTRYYDGNNRLTAEINGDNVLCEYTYNAAGDQLTETLYMTRLSPAAHDPGTRPAAPAGEARTTTSEYDLAGRVTRVVYPAIEVTTLSGVDTDNPTAAVATVQPEEILNYDAFGNLIEAVDRNGNHIYAWFDAKGRQIAIVNAEGYLTEYTYDAQDNVIEQRVYTDRLDPAQIDPHAPVAPPATGDVYQSNRSYDAANRLIEERSPLVEVFDPATRTTATERVITRYTYDGVGNQTSRTLAADSSQAYTEYMCYDALDRRVAVIDGNRVVNLFGYDANGNNTLVKRFFNPLAAGVDPAALDGSTDFAALVGANENDQQINRAFDALNQLTAETALMGPGGEDDLVKTFGYDAAGNRTYGMDEDGYVQKFDFDAAGNMLKSVSPDNSGTIYQYDAAGNAVLTFTGQLDSLPAPAANAVVTLGQNLTINWDLPASESQPGDGNQPAGANVQSYVVYDTASHTGIDGYANQSAVQGTWFSDTGAADIPTASLTGGDSLYFRIVTQDAAGSITWTAEQKVSLPPRLTDVAIAQTGADTVEVTATFESGAASPQLIYGAAGAAGTAVNFTDQGGGVFTATLSNVTNLQELVYRVAWQDGQGGQYSSTETPFEARGNHTGITEILSESTIVDGSDTLYKAHIDTTVPAALAGDLVTLAATWQRTDIEDGATGSVSVIGADSGLGYSTYGLVLGDDAPLAAGTYRIDLIGVAEEEDLVLDSFEITLGGAPLAGTRHGISWAHPDAGDDQVLIVDGQRIAASRQDGRLVADPGLAAGGSATYSVFYGTAAAEDHTTTVTSTEITQTVTDDSTTPPTVTTTVLGYDLGLSVALSAAEAAGISGDLHLAWRPAGTGTDFTNDLALTTSGATFDATLAQLAAGQYDFKVYYLDSAGREVIVDWMRADTAQASAEATGQSVTVEASETGGGISVSIDDVATVDPGLYSGPVGDILDTLVLAPVTADPNTGSIARDGRDTGYFIESQYNALNALIATNSETGQWRQYGVDANGNAVATYNYGLDRTGAPVITYSAFDAGNREIARFDAAVSVDGEADPRRPVTRREYDLSDNVVKETDARGMVTQSTYNALNSLIRRSFAQGTGFERTTIYQYDRLGRGMADSNIIGLDADDNEMLGATRSRTYDTVGNLISQTDGEGRTTTYTYDVFGRRTAVTNAMGQHVTMAYDQRDRLIKSVEGEGNALAESDDARYQQMRTELGYAALVADLNDADRQALRDRHAMIYAYDGRDNRTSTIHQGMAGAVDYVKVLSQVEAELRAVTEEHENSLFTYVTHPYSGTQKQVIQKRAQELEISYDYWNESLLAHPVELHALLSAMGYDDLLEAGRMGDYGFAQVFDGLGRVEDTITYQSGQQIHERNAYDAYGNVVAETDGEGRVTTKVYGPFACLTQQVDSAGRVTLYEYDDAGNQTREWNPAGGKDIQRTYDEAGRLLSVDDIATGVSTTYTFDIAGSRKSETVTTPDDAHNRSITYGYDAIGQMTRWADSVTGMHTHYEWDGLGNLQRTTTDPGYDPNMENIDLSGLLDEVEAEIRAITGEIEVDNGIYVTTEIGPLYTGTQNDVIRARALDLGVDLTVYDELFKLHTEFTLGQPTESYWTETLTDYHGGLGNLLKDMGYGDRFANYIIDPDYQLLRHDYTYYADNRIHQMIETKADGTTVTTTYGYDAAGNRQSVTIDGTATTYYFDADGKVIRAESNGVTTMDWQYDAAGNVSRFRTFNGDGSVKKTTISQYYENNRNYYTDDNGQRTTQTMDLTGRVSRTQVIDGYKIYTYDHGYNAAGLETSVSARGDRVSGHTTNVYDANDKLITSNKGAGDQMNAPEVLRFVYNNDGQILYRFHDTGKYGEVPTETEFAYANGHPVGQTGNEVNGNYTTLLDSGKYNLVQPIGEDLPASTTSVYTVQAGDTLQTIAAAVYGNPSLWFVLAEANNLDPGAELIEGQLIEIPSTVKSGRLTVDTHVVYNEAEIIGSTLPNLKSDPPDKGCGNFLMIIIVVVIAIVIIYATEGLAAKVVIPALEGILGAGAVATIAGFVIAGAIVGAVASMVQQGLFMALGYQDEFSWGKVAAGAVSGAFSGAAKGLSALAEVAETGTFIANNIQYVKVAAAALKVAGAASSQLIENGKITSWTSLAAAGVSGYLDTAKSSELGNLARAQKAAKAAALTDNVDEFTKQMEAIESINSSIDNINSISSTMDHITPWVQLAETYVRNDGELTPTDWAIAVGSTVSSAVSEPGARAADNSVRRIAANMVVAGALSTVDKNAAMNYLISSVGNEMEQFINQRVEQGLYDVYVSKRRSEAKNSGGATMADPMPDTYDADWDGQNLQSAPTSSDHQKSQDTVGASTNEAKPGGTLGTDEQTMPGIADELYRVQIPDTDQLLNSGLLSDTRDIDADIKKAEFLKKVGFQDFAEFTIQDANGKRTVKIPIVSDWERQSMERAVEDYLSHTDPAQIAENGYDYDEVAELYENYRAHGFVLHADDPNLPWNKARILQEKWDNQLYDFERGVGDFLIGDYARVLNGTATPLDYFTAIANVVPIGKIAGKIGSVALKYGLRYGDDAVRMGGEALRFADDALDIADDGLRVADDFVGATKSGVPNGETIYFGQRRVGPNFSTDPRFPHTSGKSLDEVVQNLTDPNHYLTADDLPITAFRDPKTGVLVSQNTRTRAVLAEAGLEPTKVEIVDLYSLSRKQRAKYLNRLIEEPVLEGNILPSTRVPMTPSQQDLSIMKVIEIK